MNIFMTNTSKMHFILSLVILTCLSIATNISLAAPAQSGSCPVDHEHMGHIADLAQTQISSLKQRADSDCSSCHGTDGVSVSNNIPNLAGQESLYLCAWLEGCRKQGNQCEGHEDLAGKFTDLDIVNLSEYYAHLPAVKW
jgi:cytochrome c553